MSLCSLFQARTKPFANKVVLPHICILSCGENATRLKHCTTSTHKVRAFCFMFHVSCFMFHVSCFMFHVSCSMLVFVVPLCIPRTSHSDVLVTRGYHSLFSSLGTGEHHRKRQCSGQSRQQFQQRPFYHVVGAIEQGGLFWPAMRRG
jgi:hypothetical protein